MAKRKKAATKIPGREEAFRAGNALALWDEILVCEEANRPKPEWARQALIEYAKGILPSVKSKKGKGCQARARQEQQDWWDDFLVFTLVNRLRASCWQATLDQSEPRGTAEWREWRKWLRTLRSKRRTLSERQAFILVGQDRNMSFGAVRTAYKRAERRQRQGSYVSEIFGRTLQF
jgi:hypothetical protein